LQQCPGAQERFSFVGVQHSAPDWRRGGAAAAT
jgi:hypothetical protein